MAQIPHSTALKFISLINEFVGFGHMVGGTTVHQFTLVDDTIHFYSVGEQPNELDRQWKCAKLGATYTELNNYQANRITNLTEASFETYTYTLYGTPRTYGPHNLNIVPDAFWNTVEIYSGGAYNEIRGEERLWNVYAHSITDGIRPDSVTDTVYYFFPNDSLTAGMTFKANRKFGALFAKDENGDIWAFSLNNISSHPWFAHSWWSYLTTIIRGYDYYIRNQPFPYCMQVVSFEQMNNDVAAKMGNYYKTSFTPAEIFTISGNPPAPVLGYVISTDVVEGNGVIDAPPTAEEHYRVEFTVTPAEGYKIRTVYVKTTEGTRPVPLNGSAADSTTERTFSFPMPAEAVTIYAKFTNGDEPTGDGGDGEQDDATVDVPTAVPAIDVENQVVRNYLVNKANLAKLAQALTKVDLEDGTGKRKFPISVYNYILAIRAYPINPLTHDAHHLTTVNNFVINGIDLGIEEFEGYYPSSGYNYVVRLGSIDVKGYYGNYMDYSPMTKYQLYLPYLGFVDLDGSLIVGKTLSVDYAYNYNDGDFMARIYTGTEDTRSCILTKMGSFTARLPVTAVDATNAINQRDGASMRGLAAAGAIGLALAGTIITAGTAPATLAGAAAISKSALVFGVTTAGGLATIYDAVRNYNDAGRNVQYSRSGDLSGFMAFYAPQKCYLYIDRPESAEPDDFVKYRGYRSEKTVKIGDLTGYTKIRDVILDGVDLTVGEKAELLTALKNGVII